MDLIEHSRMYEVEDHHWWYRAMESITRSILDRHVSPLPVGRILDAGCGTGAAMANYLPCYGRVTGFDISGFAVRMCRLRNLSALARASVTDIPIASAGVDLVTCFDVIVTVEQDARTVREFFRVLRPGGHLLIRVAAYDWLRAQHDENWLTARRYTAGELKQLLSAAGFQVMHLTYANTFLFPLAAGKRLLERLWPPSPDASDLTFANGVFDGIFRRVLASEGPIASRSGLPFGLSLFALARKPPPA